MKHPTRLLKDPATPASLRQALEAEVTAARKQGVGALKAAVIAGAATTAAAGVAKAAVGTGAASQAAPGLAVGGTAGKVVSGALAAKVIGGVAAVTIAVGSVGYLTLDLGETSAPAAVESAASDSKAREAPAVQPQPAAAANAPAVDSTAELLPAIEIDTGISNDVIDQGAAPDPDIDAPQNNTADRRVPLRQKGVQWGAAGGSPPSVSPPPTPSTSSLTHQIELYESGRSALRGSRYARAIGQFEAYLDAYPGGSLRREASLSLLEAYIEAGRVNKGEALAATLLEDAGYADRRGELMRVRAECLALMGRCGQAEGLFERALQTPGSGVTEVSSAAAMRACRALGESSR